MFKILLLASFIPALLAFSACSSGSVPDSVVSSLCNSNDECVISVGDPIDITATFTAAFSTGSVHPTIWAFVDGEGLQIDTDDVFDGCASLTPGCPIVQGQVYTYELNVPVDDTGLSGLEADLELALVADDGTNLVCISFSAWIN